MATASVTIPAHMRYRNLAVMLVIALCALSLQAQSGRRRTVPPPAAPVPTPTPEPTPTPKKSTKENELLFFLGANRNFSYSNLPFSYYDAALRGCAEKLRTGSSAGVDVTNKDLSRGEAIKKAKAETKTYVVMLTLTVDTMARSYDDLVLEYVVFAPGTAKSVANGRAYMNGRRAGPVVVGPPTGTSNVLFREELLKRAGEDAGERILKSLHVI